MALFQSITHAHVLGDRFLGNTLQAYAYCFLTIAGGFLAVWLMNRIVLRGLKRLALRTETTFDDFLILALEKFASPALYALVVYFALRDLALKPSLAKGLQLVLSVWIAAQAVRLLSGVLREVLERHMAHRAESEETAEQEKKSVRGILVVVNAVLWLLAIVLVLDNLGIRVSTFVAGLGITGIAVALAAQAILGDLFSYFVIFFDRPFQVGHTIKVGAFQGEVESIGVKTTRIRSVSGELIVVSNKYLTDNQVQNFRHLTRRRALINFDVEYSTPGAKLREIPVLVGTILRNVPRATFERCHFQAFAESGLRFEIVFFVEAPEMRVYMDSVQEFNLQLKEALETRGIAFAFPTRNVRMLPGAAS